MFGVNELRAETLNALQLATALTAGARSRGRQSLLYY
jgi:hypothetical protein